MTSRGRETRLLLTGWSLHLPGVPEFDGATPEKAATVLGRKGLLYKEPSTRLALCAVHRALGFEPGQRATGPIETGTAVVACSNLGNVETVAKVTRAVEAGGGRAVSVLDAPNVSPNVVASTVALWFGFGGPNLMLCSGSTAGHAGLRMASLLLRSGRATRVVLVGAEPEDEIASILHDGPLRAGSACVILEPWCEKAGQVVVDVDPSEAAPPPRRTVGPGGFDVKEQWGDFYGAHGVVELALAAHFAVAEGEGRVGIGPRRPDGGPSVTVTEHSDEMGYR
ncbi:beta-ketoacyl synthase N-terminal-like domain-containing protein [Amycolatopsis decaplanina]|uniref:Beta-ketoacyl synthase n=1 Tax=Amycolatopsis decaplanina DSM 44594 TaxID=1284240 RepID=M2ZBI2_9PSEU|nr:beta-ketoacyl synthase N-terminal-like domain-containing protein [Amycolatopsis decaplanina]EME64692.1 beta-ketoacyl synthase [Amycolatopsis decaplanina DSM 44594]